MIKAVLHRIGYAAILLIAVLILNFTLIHIAPGDPVDTLVGEMGGASPEFIAQMRAAYGLDEPFVVQLGVYLSKVLQGDFGHSLYFNQPVVGLILHRLGPTLLLVITSILIAIFLGTLLGVVAAQRRNSWLSHVVTVFSLIGYSTPVFWVGVMLILVFSVALPIFPIAGMYRSSSTATGLAFAFEVLHHLVLPSITLALIYLAFYTRLARASMLDVLDSDYVRTARAKGLSNYLVIYKHALRNAILPVVTFAGLQFGQVLSGAVLVETVFSWPGLGTLAYDSILRRDTPTLLAILFFSASLVIVINIITDIVYRGIDPRMRGEK